MNNSPSLTVEKDGVEWKTEKTLSAIRGWTCFYIPPVKIHTHTDMQNLFFPFLWPSVTRWETLMLHLLWGKTLTASLILLAAKLGCGLKSECLKWAECGWRHLWIYSLDPPPRCHRRNRRVTREAVHALVWVCTTEELLKCVCVCVRGYVRDCILTYCSYYCCSI